jgi:AraC-like DNA-binding protein
VRRQKKQGRMPLHDHPITELVIVTSGQSNHLLEEDSFHIQAGDVFVVPPGVRHGYDCPENLMIVNLMFDLNGLGLPRLGLDELPGYHALFTFEPRLRRERQFSARLRLSMARIDEIDQLVAGIEQEVLQRSPGGLFAAASYLMQVIVALSRDYSAQQHEESLDMVRLGTVMTFLEGHYDEAFSVEDLAHMAHMSERSFYRAFQTALGCAPLEYILGLRLQRASELLRSTDLKLDEVANRTGFSDGGYLSRQFRKHFHVSPRDYRRRVLSQ